MTQYTNCLVCEPLIIRCGNCGHVLSMNERENYEGCKSCGKGVCSKCGSPDFSYPLYSWHEYAVKCSKCGEEYG